MGTKKEPSPPPPKKKKAKKTKLKSSCKYLLYFFIQIFHKPCYWIVTKAFLFLFISSFFFEEWLPFLKICGYAHVNTIIVDVHYSPPSIYDSLLSFIIFITPKKIPAYFSWNQNNILSILPSRTLESKKS